MLNSIKKHRLALFFTVYFVFNVASNIVHPVTPAFLQMINCPNSMFGFAYSTMALGQFITSAFWGKIGDHIGYAKAASIGLLGYALSGFMFSVSKSGTAVLLSRFFAGISSSSILVNTMAYLTSADTTPEERNSLLVLYASMQAIGAAFGYLVGGLIGDINIYYSFYTQIIIILALARLMFFVIKEQPTFIKSSEKLTFREANPFTTIFANFKLINAMMGVFLLVTLLAYFASTGFDQNFNYYLRVKFNFAPSSSGLFKAAVGIISLITNMTVSLWIAKKANISKALSVSLAFTGFTIIAMVLSTSQGAVLVFAMIYYALFAVFNPLLQSVMLKNNDTSSKGSIAGLYNAAMSFGKMTGPAFAGLIFDINPDYAFLTFGIILIVASVIAMVNYRQLKNVGIYKD